MDDKEHQLRKDIQDHLEETKSAKDIFGLFKLLGYPAYYASSKRKKDSFDFKKEDSEKIKEIYSILSFGEKLSVFLLEASTDSPSFIKSVAATFDRQYPEDRREYE
jgi:hypothetical protein